MLPLLRQPMRTGKVVLRLRLGIPGRSLLLEMFLDPLVRLHLLLVLRPDGAAMMDRGMPFDVLQEIERLVRGFRDAHTRQEGRNLVGFEWMDQLGTDQDDQFRLTAALGHRGAKDGSDDGDISQKGEAFATRRLLVLNQAGNRQPLPILYYHNLQAKNHRN